MKAFSARHEFHWAVLGLCGFLVLSGAAVGQATRAEHAADVPDSYGKLPLYFIENRGVYPGAVAYYVQGTDKTLFFTPGGITFLLSAESRKWVVKLDFVGADPDARPQGMERQAAVFSHFRGKEENWKTGLPTFRKVVYRDLWPGIDLVYSGTVNRLKYEFLVSPGAEPGKIRLRYRGASCVAGTESGALRVETPLGSFEDAPPVAYQLINARRVGVEMAYAPEPDGAFGFRVGQYDATRPLVLDPAIFVYSGFIGGRLYDYISDVAVDNLGNAYVVGSTHTNETNRFPLKVGPFLVKKNKLEAFVAKVNAAGTSLVYCGYIGGNDGDYGRGIAVDGAGNAYVTGMTMSKDFPVKLGPSLAFPAPYAAFVARVNAAGTALDYCGYIGGSGSDHGNAIAVDQQGNAYITGSTSSGNFPRIVGPDLSYNGGVDAFVARVNYRGTHLDYSGFIGGTGADSGNGIAVDASGFAYVTGDTQSSESSFPVMAGPDLSYNGGEGGDAFVAKVKVNGAGLMYCGYIGGTGGDQAEGIAVDSAGNACVIGGTTSPQNDFPVVVGPDLIYNGKGDLFVAKVKANPNAPPSHPQYPRINFDFCGYIGGSGQEYWRTSPRTLGLCGIALDPSGNVYVCGTTYSSDLPVRAGPDLTYNPVSDGFVAKLKADGSNVTYCGFIGAPNSNSNYEGEHCTAIAVDRSGNAYLVGRTDSSRFPTKLGPVLTYQDRIDGWICKVALILLEASGTPRIGSTVNLTVTASDDGGLPFQLASSLGTGPIQVDTRQIGLSLDPLLVTTVWNLLPGIFQGYSGTIQNNGHASAAVHVLNDPVLVGVTIHTAFVTLEIMAPSGIKSISNTCSFTIKN